MKPTTKKNAYTDEEVINKLIEYGVKVKDYEKQPRFMDYLRFKLYRCIQDSLN